jgi:UDP-GlcNAc3NAcA epimerase
VARRRTVVSVVGARPQFVKLAPLSTELRKRFREIVVHTGQHYDHSLSNVFFEDLPLPTPDYNLGVGSALHGKQTGLMMERFERVLSEIAPDAVIVYGDTNSTLAGALVAAKMKTPLVHVEAGLRSFRRHMPEEINRVVADRLSDLLCCPTSTAVKNLRTEGIRRGVVRTGDVMSDTLHAALPKLRSSDAVKRYGVSEKKPFVLATVHRAENTDDRARLRELVRALGRCDETVLFPAHPRTQERIERWRIRMPRNTRVIEPPGYIDFLSLLASAKAICTDSGGVQKEAAILGTPCFTLREETEWVESVRARLNRLVPPERWPELGKMVARAKRRDGGKKLYPRGASRRIAVRIESLLS